MSMRKLICFSLVLAMASIANGAVSMVDATSVTVNISDVIVIKVTSDTAPTSWTWGVYLRSDYANTDLQSAAVIKTSATVQGAGDLASVTLTDPVGYDGDDYSAARSGGSASAKLYANVDWSTVNFVSTAIGIYNVDLYDYGTSGGTYSSPPAAASTKTIEVIPEPATVALLGLGGLFLLRRRK